MPYFPLSITIADYYNRQTKKFFEVEAIEFTSATAIAMDFIADLDAIIDGQVTTAVLGAYMPLDALKSGPAQFSNIDEAGRFTAVLDKMPPSKVSIRVPTMSKDFFDSEGRANIGIDAPQDIENFMDDFTGAISIPISDRDRAAFFINCYLEKP